MLTVTLTHCKPITTRFCRATKRRCAGIKVRCEGFRSRSYQFQFDTDDAHKEAVERFLSYYDLSGDWVMSETKTGFVAICSES